MSSLTGRPLQQAGSYKIIIANLLEVSLGVKKPLFLYPEAIFLLIKVGKPVVPCGFDFLGWFR